MRSIPALIVVPENAPRAKKENIAALGETIVSCPPTLADREATTQRLIAQHGYELVHPYDDTRVIAGQATAALELLDEIPDLDTVIVPVGGGGLLTGMARALRYGPLRLRVTGHRASHTDTQAKRPPVVR